MDNESCQECGEEADWIYEYKQCYRRLCGGCYGDITIIVCQKCEMEGKK